MNKWVNKKRDQKKSDDKGFTLIELLVAVSILAILAGIVIFKVNKQSSNAAAAAAATNVSVINTAEQAYCNQNGQYGTIPQLVAARFLVNPPLPVSGQAVTVDVNTVPGNAANYTAFLNGCGASVYNIYPQNLTQPDGTATVINTPPKKIFVVDDSGPPFEEVAALGVLPYGGAVNRSLGGMSTSPNTGIDQATHGDFGISPVLNTAGTTSTPAGPFMVVRKQNNAALIQALPTKPDLIVGDSSVNDQNYQSIAPVFTSPNAGASGAYGATQASNLYLLPWFPSFVALAAILDRQVQAAQFLAAFESAAAGAGVGGTVSILEPGLNSTPTTGTQVQIDNPIASSTTAWVPFLPFMGLSIVSNCSAANANPASCNPNSNNGTGVPTVGNLAANSQLAPNLQWMPGQYMIALSDTSGFPISFAQQLFSSPTLLGNMPQVTCAGLSGGLAGHGGLPCVLIGETPTFGSVSNAGGSMAVVSTTVTLPPSLLNIGGTSNYCTAAGVPILAGLTCSGTTAVSYSETLSAGIWPDGPISELAAIPWFAQDL